MDSYRVVRDHAYSEILTVEPKNLLGRILEIRDLGISLVRLVDRGNENIDLVAEKFKKLWRVKYSKKEIISVILKGDRIVDINALETLEWNKIVENIQGFCKSSIGRKKVEELEIFYGPILYRKRTGFCQSCN